MTAAGFKDWAPLVSFILGLLIMLAAGVYGSIVTKRMIRIVNAEQPEDKKIPSYAIGPLSRIYNVYDLYRERKHGSLDKQVTTRWLILAGGFALSMLSMVVIERMY